MTTASQNGVKNVIEVPIGIDGLTFIQAEGRPAAQPDPGRHLQGAGRQSVRQGRQHRADLEGRQSVASGDQDPRARPAADVGHARQPGRALSSTKGCEQRSGDEGTQEDATRTSTRTSAPRSARTAPSSRPARTTICSSRRSPPTRARSACSAISFLEENADKVSAGPIAGVAPTEATIADLSYPGARKLYVYVKGEHLAAKPAIKRFHRGLCQGMGQGRPAREARPGAVRRRRCRGRDGKQATELTPLDPASLK